MRAGQRIEVPLPIMIVALSLFLAFYLGGNITARPILLPAIGLLTAILIVTTIGRTIEPLFMSMVAVLFLGYMLQGRTFAYLGVPPIYIGELVLLLGLAAVVVTRHRIRLDAVQLLILMFMSLGLLRTIPRLPLYEFHALRDAAIWYYAAFAILIANFLTLDRLIRFLTLVARLLPLILVWFLLTSTVLRVVDASVPNLPGTTVPIFGTLKPGDRGVFLVALAAFMSTGLYDRVAPRAKLPKWAFWFIWTATAGIVAVDSRGGFLALAAGMGVLFLLRPSLDWVRIGLIGASLLALLLVTDVSIDREGSRALSVDQLTINVQSIVSDNTDDVGSVQGTRDWRLSWWSQIYDDAFAGSLKWTGWGFGPNLASIYGYQISDGSLRSPHSIHINILGRMGIPGLALWTVLQVAIVGRMLMTISAARRSGNTLIASMAVVILCFWSACMMNGSFDVFLEGPQGAIPFWIAIGAGIFLATQEANAPSKPVDKRSALSQPSPGSSAYVFSHRLVGPSSIEHAGNSRGAV